MKPNNDPDSSQNLINLSFSFEILPFGQYKFHEIIGRSPIAIDEISKNENIEYHFPRTTSVIPSDKIKIYNE